ncbi:MAG: ABC transporter ATP-binding protein [Actinobacteria bacterium]|nr:ABC transporter ATP-binding protein [Actinomycetota bacterium]
MTGGPAEPVLSVEGLEVHYRVRVPGQRGKVTARAVDGVDLVVHAGETLALVGESGSGKTSIANAVMRLIEPAAGRIVFDGIDLVPLRGRALRKMRPHFQMIFQDPFESLDPRRTVLDTVMEPLVINGIGESADDRRKLALVALARAGLTPPERMGARFTHQLSGGQRQRVAIAAAMILEPALVVADEPVSMLDVSLRAGILTVMADMRDRLGVAYLFITHDLSLAWMFADRIAVVYLGRVVEEGTSADLIDSPAHPYTRALVSVIPVPETSRDAQRTVLSGETPNPSAIPSGCRFHTRCPLYRELGEPARCREVDPMLAEVHSVVGGHRAACHFIDQQGVS